MTKQSLLEEFDRLEMNDTESKGCSVCLAEMMGGKNMEILYKFLSKAIDQTRQETIKEVEGLLPEPKKSEETDYFQWIYYTKGFNDCLERIKSLINK